MSSSISTSDLTATDFYGKLIDVPEAGTAKLPLFAFVVLGLVFAVIGFVEYVYRAHPYYNQEIGLTMAGLDDIKKKEFETVILSDSVMRQVFWGVDVADDVAVLSVSARTTLLGNELIARRFFDNGNTAKRFVLAFTVPGLVTEPPAAETDTHLRPVFTRASERRLLRERLGEDSLDDLPPRSIFKRKQALDAFLAGDKGVSWQRRLLVPTERLEDPIHTVVNPRTSARAALFGGSDDPNEFLPVKPFTQASLSALVEYIQSQGSDVMIVIPPHIDAVAENLERSDLMAMIRNVAAQTGATVRNINDVRSYPQSAFVDEGHLYPIWEDRALRDLETFVPSLVGPQGVGDMSEFELPISLPVDDLFFRSSVRVRQDGKVGRAASRFTIPVYAASEQQACLSAEVLARDDFSNSFKVQLNYGPADDWHFPPGPEWQDADYARPLALKPGWNAVRILKRERGVTPLASISLKPCGDG